MNPAAFYLEPHPGLPFPRDVVVRGSARRAGTRLRMAWSLAGPPGAFVAPAPPIRPERRRGLWEDTCCEFFLAFPERPGYREFNLSPAGHWNVFRFDSYRAGMREETAFAALAFAAAGDEHGCEVTAEFDLAPLDGAAGPWRLAVATVVSGAGGLSYWALAHPRPEPDFHDAGGFLIRLDA
ncbi:MAG: DOMON-like domain-containing protein [Candidatus Sericytochromatia bacterium]|nr:DOMON-like domain-containing protein [Candidatus Tanganyikabacteria bacterium]